jgi:hypothetical protein
MSLVTPIIRRVATIARRSRGLVTRFQAVDPAWQRRAGWELEAGLWLLDGRPETSSGIPDEAKAFYLLRAIRATGASVFVETGTFHGNMVARLRSHVAEAHTIELSLDLYLRAKQRFEADPHVHVHHGDSAVVLPSVLQQLQGPAVIYLDGHYSGGDTARGAVATPVWDELRAVAASPHRHAVVIDDARGFGVWPGYPPPAEIAAWVRENLRTYVMVVDTDEICLLPSEIANCMR